MIYFKDAKYLKLIRADNTSFRPQINEILIIGEKIISTKGIRDGVV